MKLHKFVTALIALAMLLSPLLIFGTSSAGIAPPPDDLINGVQYIDGDWVISGYENYSNEIIYLTGNLTVTGTGMLAFENVTLLMNNTNSDGEHFILVQDGGTFYVNDTDGNPATTYDRSVITNSELEPYGYDFQTNATGTLEVRNSVIRRCGILTGGAGKEKSGLISHSDSTFIENTELYFNANGLVSDSAGFKMLNCSIHDNLFYGIRVLNSTSPANQVSLILSNTTINSNQDSGIYVESDFIDMSLDNNTVENNGAGGVIVTSHRNVNGTFRDNDIVNNSNEGGIGIWGSSDLCEIRVDLTGNNLSHNTGLAPLRLGFRHNEIPVHSVWVNASNNDIWGVGSYDGLVLILAVDSITANFTDNNFISPYTQNGFHLGQISKEFNVNPSTRVVRAEIHNNNISNLASGAVRVCAVKDIFCNMTGNHVYHPDGAMTCGAVTFGWFKSGLDYSTPENATINFKNNIIEGLQDTGGLGMKAIYNLNADVENNTILDTHGMGIKLGWMDDSEYTQTTKLWSRPTRNVQAKVCNNTVSGRGGPGIWLYSLSGSRVYDNTISARTGLLTRKLVGAGIRIQDTNGAAEIFNNSVSGCEAFGIQLYHSAGVSVHDNLMSANTYGMALNSFSKHNVLFNNIILKSASQYGYYLTSDSLDHAIPDNNTVNGEWLRYFYDTHGSPGTPVLIENHIIQEPLMSNLGQIILANSSYVSLQNNVAAQGMNGIYLYNVDHSMIARNDIQDNTLLATSHGLHLESNTSDNIIESNNFENNFNGIAILSNSVRNRFWYNQLNKSDTQIGLLMGTDGTVWNNDIPPNNTVCGTPVRYYFMEDGLNLADITVATPLMSNLGQFIVLDSSNLSFSNITLSKGYSGFYLANLQNATFRRLNASANNNNFYCRNSGNISIFDSKAEAGNINLELDNVQNLHADNVTQLGGTYSVRLTSSNGTILNSTLSNATLYTLNLATGSQLELVNTTFHNATLNSDSVLNVSWYLDLAVECNLQPVESANVTVTNASGFIAFDGLTAPDGTIRNIRLKEYEMTPNGTAFQTPYNLSVSQETLGDYTQSLNMSRTTHLDVTLGDLTAPEITVEPTITPGILGTSTDTAWLNVTIEDTGVCPGPIADAEWFLSTTMPQIVNGTGFPMLASDGILDGSNESLTSEIDIAQYSKGPRTFWVHGKDASGNWCGWKSLSVNVVDDEGPRITGTVSYSPATVSTKLNEIWLTLTLDDAGLGDSKVTNAVCTAIDSVGISYNLTSLSVTAKDGFLNEINETVSISVDITALPHGIYAFYLKGTDEFGNLGTERNITVEILDGDAPAKPQGLIVIAMDGQVELSWTPNTEDDLAGYKIYRTMWSGSNYELVGTVGPNTTNWQDSGLENGRSYYYVISAFDDAPTPNVSPYSDEVSVDLKGSSDIVGSFWWVLVSAILIITTVFVIFFRKSRNKSPDPPIPEDNNNKTG